MKKTTLTAGAQLGSFLFYYFSPYRAWYFRYRPAWLFN